VSESDKRRDGIGWVINKTRPRPTWMQGRRVREGYVSPMKFNVKQCDICNSVWDLNVANDWIEVFFYSDFPTYGLDYLTCPKCDPEKIYDITNSRKKVKIRHDSSTNYASIRKASRRR
jgi:hypothetical protein